mmetsp:Transcript_42770/g.100265  ORF Transcript_42770/g.100265 Transcript_42770/m.100265 type:complete len:201 (-) Transcript_42770:105-707(-)
MREERLRVTESRAGDVLERERGRRLSELRLQLKRLHHVVNLHRLHLAGEQCAQLVLALHRRHLCNREEAREQRYRVRVRAYARGRRAAIRPRSLARQRSECERGAAKHSCNCSDRQARAHLRHENVLLAAADGEGAILDVMRSDDERWLLAWRACGQQLQVYAALPVEPELLRNAHARKLCRDEVIGLEAEAAKRGMHAR